MRRVVDLKPVHWWQCLTDWPINLVTLVKGRGGYNLISILKCRVLQDHSEDKRLQRRFVWVLHDRHHIARVRGDLTQWASIRTRPFLHTTSAQLQCMARIDRSYSPFGPKQVFIEDVIPLRSPIVSPEYMFRCCYCTWRRGPQREYFVRDFEITSFQDWISGFPKWSISTVISWFQASFFDFNRDFLSVDF